MSLNILEKTVEKIIGEPIDKIRNTTISERRRLVEAKFGKKMKIGNGFEQTLLTSEDVNKLLDEAIGPQGVDENVAIN